MRIWRSLLVCMGVLVLSSPAWGQSNAMLDKILAAKDTSYGDAAYLVMTAVKKVPDSATVENAVQAVEQEGWAIKIPDAAKPVSLGTYSLMLMKAFKLHGGIMYTIFPSPRYAARELAYLGYVHGDTSPYRDISGFEAVNILGSVLRHLGGAS